MWRSNFRIRRRSAVGEGLWVADVPWWEKVVAVSMRMPASIVLDSLKGGESVAVKGVLTQEVLSGLSGEESAIFAAHIGGPRAN